MQREKRRVPDYSGRICQVAILCLLPVLLLGQQKDTSVISLEKIIITDHKNPDVYKSAIPVQSLTGKTLQQLNISSVADASRYFSGVLVKDYGGIGGLKTISVRSLGASNTGIVYDGIPVSDMQSGQIDLSRFSSSFVESLMLFQANTPVLLTPARTFASTSSLAIFTNTFQPVNFTRMKWQGELQSGSFQHWQASGGIYLPLASNTVASVNAEGILSKGDYPFDINNGNYSEKARRSNSGIKSLQGEINLVTQFKDSSFWQTKFWGYDSERGLPGAIIFFNPRSAQKLWNQDVFLQTRYRKPYSGKTTLLLSAKYSHNYTRYVDPDFLNGQGGLDDRYHQQEYYASGSLLHSLSKNVEVAAATDLSYSDLKENKQNYTSPSRLGMWNSISFKYADENWQFLGSLLNNYFRDHTKTDGSAVVKDKLTPAVAISFKRDTTSPLLFRFFYKGTFRMPTFNDLYYNFIGNRDLRPEYSVQYNLGTTYSVNLPGKVRRISISADGYFNKIEDKIVAVPNQNLFNWSMLNLGKVHVRGLDVNSELNVVFSPTFNWYSRLAYTFQHAIDVTDPSSSSYKNRIPYTPDNSGSILILFHYRSWSAGYSGLFSGKRYAMGTNNIDNELLAWMTHDLTLSRSVVFSGFEMNILAGLYNFTDISYDVVRYFPMPCRSFKISISIRNL